MGALLTTVAACIMIMVQAILDYSGASPDSADPAGVVYPMPTAEGSFKAFGSIMFAFAGASTFPTIQADMREREKFNVSAIIACVSK